jgi:hypothetical protein
MHLLIPFAAPASQAGREALAALRLPVLRGLMRRLRQVQIDLDDGLSLSPPHERALAQALGLHGGDGRLPWAAHLAAADGVAVSDGTSESDHAWALVTPAHWHLGTDQVSLIDPDELLLDEPASRALCGAVRELFEGDGLALHYGAPQRWYAVEAPGSSAAFGLATLATAALDRVIGRNVDAWLGADPALRRIRRLQSEVQMLLYTHPINEKRESQGLLPVNSFWLSGCGPAQPVASVPPVVDARLRSPALANDWPAWCRAWETLDAGPLADFSRALSDATPATGTLRLTLCGERGFASFEPLPPGPSGLVQRLRARWSAPSPPALLGPL